MITFILGAMLGAAFGYVLCALLTGASEADDFTEALRRYKERER